MANGRVEGKMYPSRRRTKLSRRRKASSLAALEIARMVKQERKNGSFDPNQEETIALVGNETSEERADSILLGPIEIKTEPDDEGDSSINPLLLCEVAYADSNGLGFEDVHTSVTGKYEGVFIQDGVHHLEAKKRTCTNKLRLLNAVANRGLFQDYKDIISYLETNGYDTDPMAHENDQYESSLDNKKQERDFGYLLNITLKDYLSKKFHKDLLNELADLNRRLRNFYANSIVHVKEVNL